MSEMESLNIEDLDVDQLERRVELVAVSDGGDGGGGGGSCDTYTCVGLCSGLCGVNGSCGIDFW